MKVEEGKLSGGYTETSVSRTQELRSECMGKPKVFLKGKITGGDNGTPATSN